MRFIVSPTLPLLFITPFVHHAFSQNIPPASLVSITSTLVDTVGQTAMSALGVDTTGAGCRQNSVGTALSQDRQILTLIFDDFQASIGPNVPKAQNKRTCTVKISLTVPSGWTYSLSNADYRGFCKLDEKITGIFRTSYSFLGMQGDVAKTSKVVDGPFENDFLVHAAGEQKGQPWLTCAVSGLTNGVATLVQGVAQPVTSALGGVLGGVTGLVNGLTGNLLGGVLDPLTTTVSNLGNDLGGLVTSVGEGASALVGSLVGTVLTINTQITLLSSDDDNKAMGTIQADSLDNNFKQNFEIKWKKCGQ